MGCRSNHSTMKANSLAHQPASTPGPLQLARQTSQGNFMDFMGMTPQQMRVGFEMMQQFIQQFGMANNFFGNAPPSTDEKEVDDAEALELKMSMAAGAAGSKHKRKQPPSEPKARRRRAIATGSTSFGPALFKYELPSADPAHPDNVAVWIQHPLGFSERASAEAESFKELILETVRRHGTLPIIFYSDEVTPGNVLSNRNKRKFHAPYWSIKVDLYLQKTSVYHLNYAALDEYVRRWEWPRGYAHARECFADGKFSGTASEHTSLAPIIAKFARDIVIGRQNACIPKSGSMLAACGVIGMLSIANSGHLKASNLGTGITKHFQLRETAYGLQVWKPKVVGVDLLGPKPTSKKVRDALIFALLLCVAEPPQHTPPDQRAELRAAWRRRACVATHETMSMVARVVSEQLGVDESKVTASSTFSALGADSLDVVETVMALEESSSRWSCPTRSTSSCPTRGRRG
ncbi:unnamed protein product [Prorocentrum cordatum]|uniref:Carrier domain-containing protein n=1 Tax=Prorocentrum cordatum TaxID=2364126 RepID=A0ABN9UQH4_9DINO|nr:unnamed protein product [Polarella glacialis]